MDATAWTVVGAAAAILAAVGVSFRSLRDEMRAQRKEMRDQMDAQGRDLRKRIDGLGEQVGQLRERMAHLEGLLEGLREAITRRAA